MLEHMTIRARLFLLAGVSIVGFIVIGVTGIVELAKFNVTVTTVFAEIQNSVESTANANEARQAYLTQGQAWKDILLRGNKQEAFDANLKRFEQQGGKVQYNLNKLATELGESSDEYVREIGTLAAETAKKHAALSTHYQEALKAYDPADRDAPRKVDQLAGDGGKEVADNIDDICDKIESYIVANNDRTGEAEKRYKTVRNLLMIVMAVSLAVVVLLALMIVNRITSSLLTLTRGVEGISRDWDLSRRINISGSDEIGRSASAVNRMLANFHEIVAKIVSNARQTAASSAAMSASMAHVGEVAISQSAATSDVAAAVEQLSVSVTNVRDSATESLNIAHESSSLAEQGGRVIRRASDEMVRIADSVQTASQVVEQVGTQSNEISTIVQVIRDVADQTNLLALNAAIEAARAGEQGRGFAVVADEVRKLAEKTTSSAQEISRMIDGIQSSSGRAVADIRQVVDQVASISAHAREALAAIEQIRDSARRSEEFSGNIQSALLDQSQTSELIAQKVEGIARASEENAEAAAKAGQSMSILEDESKKLQEAVSRFVM
ncbi:methyl-accepting chemotaxis protein [Denitratisoma oestradiolicum]|uniref:Methyl-accepting chemotaxis protein n=1 Tax=Denitratisoma oestradiolicum TaxID=311182 RepID=A0A6S6Y3W0_9PROT|nr:methyl-accepting chemotaxis protein [Denitratisoma oestradiolicum]TWO80172.1 hypothetical protein CBW56_11450 [Denitratisoma oestradiolicum]CAB1369980.1 conserved protein of unknown function [Denitratisoma oestradiolicum]